MDREKRLSKRDVNYCPRCGSEDIQKKNPVAAQDDVAVYCNTCGEITSLSAGAYCMDEDDFTD